MYYAYYLRDALRNVQNGTPGRKEKGKSERNTGTAIRKQQEPGEHKADTEPAGSRFTGVRRRTGKGEREAMNIAALTGRLTKAPVTRYGGQDSSVAITHFTIAVDDVGGADFINIKCLGRTAEWAEKWLSKGSKVEVNGKIKTGHYTKDGREVYYTEVLASSLGFGESKAEAEARQGNQGQQSGNDGFMDIPDGIDEELPFS